MVEPFKAYLFILFPGKPGKQRVEHSEANKKKPFPFSTTQPKTKAVFDRIFSRWSKSISNFTETNRKILPDPETGGILCSMSSTFPGNAPIQDRP